MKTFFDNAIAFFIRLTTGEIIKIDKMLHFLVSFVLASAFPTNMLLSMLIVVLANTVKECTDVVFKKSKFDFMDIAAGVCGGLFYFLKIWLIG